MLHLHRAAPYLGDQGQPFAPRSEQECTEEDDIRRSEQRENMIRERADQEGELGAEIIGKPDQQRHSTAEEDATNRRERAHPRRIGLHRGGQHLSLLHTLLLSTAPSAGVS